MDKLTREKRSWNMSRIHSCNTKPEKKLRSMLFAKGFRFRVNVRTLPGRPDIVLKKYRTIIFVHGCFWHRHPGCAGMTMPKTRPEFWTKKFDATLERDKRVTCMLQDLGWKVFVAWECQIERTPEQLLLQIEKILNKD